VCKHKYHKRNTGALLDASGDVGVEANTEKTKHMIMSPHQNVGQNHNLLTAINPPKIWQS
jgi:hypothetical protein